ncbi:tetratricopeptide repeat protein [Pseudobutyrivibrio sp.]|uniref:tetratricopeptide repeat protein n=1 Tax=Pseudobutyrivibrio sp. TaxID=2014367 RepID=UPI001DE441DE|nr:tetratricopeptide repeat protein [Pseudobutyrivibrio sp.]MBE5910247.1 tetratricopeptide repeat protein [Pseudobutyrivibrio sp.]
MKSKKIIIAIAVIIVAIAAAIAGYFLVYNSPERQLDRYLDLGAKYIEEGDYDKALEAYNMALEIDDKCTEAYIGLIHVYEETGDYEMAMQIAEQGVNMTEAPFLESKLQELTTIVNNGGSSSSSDAAASENNSATEIEEESTINIDDYVGFYSNNEVTVSIEKNGDDYSMSVMILRLFTWEDGKVNATDEGVEFTSTDGNGKPIKFLFTKDGNDSYTLKVEKTTWEYLSNGETFTDLVLTDPTETAASSSDLDDGFYFSTLLTTDPGYSSSYIRSLSFADNGFTIDAGVTKVLDPNTWNNLEDYDYATYFIAIDSNTKFYTAGGEDAPTYYTFEEFKELCEQLKDSGLGLQFNIENGVATEVGLSS